MYYGFDMGGTKIELAVFDEGLNQVWQKRLPTPSNDYAELLSVFNQLTQEADTHFKTKGKIGIGLPGIADLKTGLVFTTNIPAVKGKRLVEDLETLLERPVRINNDANCFALSEAWNNEFQQYTNILGIILGTGVGGGLIIDGKSVMGHNGITGEIGHLRLTLDALDILGIDIPQVPCGCGQIGCFEGYLSGRGFEWLFNHFYGESLNAKMIVQYYDRGGDQRILAHVERYTSLLAAYLGQICTLFDPQLIVIGGGLSNFEALYSLVPPKIPAYLYPMAQLPRIEKARYGDSGGVRGAAFLNFKK